MSDDKSLEEVRGAQGRRRFLKTAAQVAVTAPAAAILLNATMVRPAAAAYGQLADGLINTPDDSGDLGQCTRVNFAPNDQFANNPADCAAVGVPK